VLGGRHPGRRDRACLGGRENALSSRSRSFGPPPRRPRPKRAHRRAAARRRSRACSRSSRRRFSILRRRSAPGVTAPDPGAPAPGHASCARTATGSTPHASTSIGIRPAACRVGVKEDASPAQHSKRSGYGRK
jgi:hypothetical protein